VRDAQGIDGRTDPALAEVRVVRIDRDGPSTRSDELAVEEPLEIRVGSVDGEGHRVRKSVSITMRTPGHDDELAVGFLFTEGLLTDRAQVAGVRPCGSGNAVRVDLSPGLSIDLARLERHFYASSSCGVCGKASLEAVRVTCGPRPIEGQPVVSASTIRRLPSALRSAQAVFDRTGGLHASALFDVEGRLVGLREDVGRHNALDKLVGALAGCRDIEVSAGFIVVTSRASFEMVQKAVSAGVPLLAAVSAPTALAIDVAEKSHLTLVGFARGSDFVVYSRPERVVLESPSAPWREGTRSGDRTAA
jgi:FdhD protein